MPYQPLNQLSASLSAADAHAVVMGTKMLGLVHPCKIYNVLAVSATVIYTGPTPSHVTEILDAIGETLPQVRVEHGEAEKLADGIRRLTRTTAGKHPTLLPAVLAGFSKNVLLPKMIAAMEGKTLAVTFADASVGST